MATRLYLPSSGTPPLSTLAKASSWEYPSGSGDPQFARLPTFTAKQDTALTTSTGTWPTTASQQWCFWQFQSEQILTDYVPDGSETISLVIGKCAEATTSQNSHLAFTLRLVDASGAEVSVLCQRHGNSTEFAAYGSDATRIWSAQGFDLFPTLAVGDRLILEIGLTGPTRTIGDSRMRIGDPSGTSDFALTSGLTTDLDSWWELNFNLSLGTISESDLSGTVAQAANTASGALTVTDVDSRLSGGAVQGAQTASGALDVTGVVLYGSAPQATALAAGALTVTDVDCRLAGAAAQAAARAYGGLTMDGSPLIYGGAVQGAGRSYGVLLMPILTPEVALPPAGARSVLLLDGTLEVPLLQAQVYRQPAREVATAVVPAAFLAEVQAAATLDLRLRRARYDGAGVDDLLLFSGTIDQAKLIVARDRLRVPCVGAASWPLRQNRRLLGKPMYQREDEYASTVRGVIDPAVVPGDNLRFGDREVPVTKVVFNLDLHYQFMEVSSGF